MSSTIMQSLTFITFMVSEKIPMLKCSSGPDTWSTQNMLIILLEHNCHKKYIVHHVLNVYTVDMNPKHAIYSSYF